LQCASDVRLLVADMPGLPDEDRKSILMSLADVPDIAVTDYRGAFYDDNGRIRDGVYRFADGSSEVFAEWDCGYPQRLRLQVFADGDPVAGLTARPGAVRDFVLFLAGEMPAAVSDDGARRAPLSA
jgi:hypothetical protein